MVKSNCFFYVLFSTFSFVICFKRKSLETRNANRTKRRIPILFFFLSRELFGSGPYAVVCVPVITIRYLVIVYYTGHTYTGKQRINVAVVVVVSSRHPLTWTAANKMVNIKKHQNYDNNILRRRYCSCALRGKKVMKNKLLAVVNSVVFGITIHVCNLVPSPIKITFLPLFETIKKCSICKLGAAVKGKYCIYLDPHFFRALRFALLCFLVQYYLTL